MDSELMKHKMKIGHLIKHILTLGFTTAALSMFSSCVKEMEGNVQDSDTIAFTASLNGQETKGSQMVKLNGNAGIIGYVYDSWPEEDEAMELTPWENLAMEAFSFDGYILTSRRPIKWSDVENTAKTSLRVYAYSPLEDENMTMSCGTEAAPTLPTMTYTVPVDISKQKDIVTAISDVDVSFRKNIPLTFDHILTGIKFKAGFDCTVKSITICNVASTGTYVLGEGWSEVSGNETYQISFGSGKEVKAGEMITDDENGNVLFMIPQRFNGSSTVTLEYNDGESISTPLNANRWEEGRMVSYTLYKTAEGEKTIYFDLAAGNVTINATKYTGSVYINGGTEVYTVTGTYDASCVYHVYQSTPENQTSTGWSGAYGTSTFTLPTYSTVMVGDIPWREWITNNTSVENVIEKWDNEAGTAGAAISAGRKHTLNKISVSGALKCNLVIDNIYTRYQHKGQNRSDGGITFLPTSTANSELTVNILGDNRVGCIHYVSGNTSLKNKLILQGTGSLTVADVDFYKSNNGYYSNHYDSVIGGSDNNSESWGIVINGGTIFAGSTKAENCSAIGAGGNGTGHVTINGGIVTAVASTTGTAIGGGIGYSDKGGIGHVHIYGGNVYAYNFRNVGNIPSSAIGGAGSNAQMGNTGNVGIYGGNIYAYSELGTAIGGGSSSTKEGGDAFITINGNATVIAKSGTENAGIGGGTGGTDSNKNGGNANITISGNPIIRTGSIGGGKTRSATGKIGSANIHITGGDIQAQFVMAAGAKAIPSFTMEGGMIRNSDTEDTEFIHIQKNGGAVYLEDGTFTMTAGEISQCYAEKGGAIYIKGSETTTFSMTGGTITECSAETDGGAVYLQGGNVSISGGTVSHNLAYKGNGGGFCIVGGNFSMPEGGTGMIAENAAFDQNNVGGKGGGIYVTSAGDDVFVDIISGSITMNSSDRVGGGISVDMTGNETASAKVTVGKAGGDNLNPSITDNHTIILGGGLYAKGAKADITINSGRIAENTISGYVANPDVANEGGMVTLNGGEVTHVVVTYNNNGSYLGFPMETGTQKIVTSTNSTMIPATFSRLGYKLTSWNTRPDGKGKTYTAGQIMNLDSNLTLYAQWIND